MPANFQPNQSTAREGYISVRNANMYYRDMGRGDPLIILHGGPDFDHTYLLPEMDRLSDPFRLIYYDQRGRGRSAEGVDPEDVSIQSEMDDLESLREYFRLERVAVVGHSWGGVLAMEYAVRYPDRISQLILMDTAPASHEDFMLLRQELPKQRAVGDVERMSKLASSLQYKEGDPETVADYYRIHFSPTIKRPDDLEKVILRLRSTFTISGILKARAIEDRLREETWLSDEYDLFPKLKQLRIPALVIHGDYDFIPMECAKHIARVIPGARFVLLEDCGHFSFMERPDEVSRTIRKFIDEPGS